MNYNEVLITEGLHRLVHHNGRVQPGETAVVVADYKMERFAAPLAAQLRAAGADTTVCIMPPTGGDGNEPTVPVAEAMKAADVIFSPVSTSVTHTRAMRAALDEGGASRSYDSS
jgi:2,5-dihydroxypyridine 5,6-dioxygenase